MAKGAPTVRVDGGVLRGASTRGVDAFYGIPYAHPPVADRRFLPPAPAEPWMGTRDATDFGPDCLQGDLRPSRPQSEDCLLLNVWTPQARSGRLPVMVFIHGGAFREGGASYPLYDARDLAARGVVAVTLNYRLGPMGFLVSLRDGLAGNLGLWDQQAALEWVQRNVGVFGGDAGQVTLFGESAGAMSIAVHLTLRSSEHLFARAIMQSNPQAYQYRPVHLADKLGWAFMRRFACDSVRCMQDEPADAIVREWGVLHLPRSSSDFIYWGPVHGPGSGVDRPPQMWADLARRPRPKPVLLGSNAHEGPFFVALAFGFKLPRFAYLTTVGVMFKLAAPRVLALYESLPPDSSAMAHPATSNQWRRDHRQRFGQILTDYLFRCAVRNATARWHAHARRSSHKAPAYLYHFRHRSRHTGPAPCRGLACHMSELPFVFNRTENGVPTAGEFSEDEAALVQTVTEYWLSFARHGHPNGKLGGASGADRPHWSAWTPGAPAQMLLEWPPRLDGSACDAACAVWDEVGYEY